MIRLGVNIDHVVTVREARGGSRPDVLTAARIALEHGADGITVHLREDRRHINDADVYALRNMLDTGLNLEMSIADEIVEIAVTVKPEQATLVPEKREELTTEGGLDVFSEKVRVKDVVKKLKDQGIRVSLFIDPDIAQIEATIAVGAPCIELHTGEYANAVGAQEKEKQLARLIHAAAFAHKNGLCVNAGHGLDYDNVSNIVAIPCIHELNIGHSLIAEAIFTGLGPAVAKMKSLLVVV